MKRFQKLMFMNVTNILNADNVKIVIPINVKIVLQMRFRIYVVAIEKHMIVLSNCNINRLLSNFE